MNEEIDYIWNVTMKCKWKVIYQMFLLFLIMIYNLFLLKYQIITKFKLFPICNKNKIKTVVQTITNNYYKTKHTQQIKYLITKKKKLQKEKINQPKTPTQTLD